MLNIETGLFSGMVLQRTRRDVSDQLITGRTDQGGKTANLSQLMRVRVTQKGKPVRGVKIVGRVARGQFKAQLVGLRVGGPYVIELAIGAESVEVRDVLVGDVWLLTGQSNMFGCGLFPDRAKPSKSVRGFYMDDHWRVAEDPLHNMWNAVDEVHATIGRGLPAAPGGPKKYRKGVGPGVAFGKKYFSVTGVPQGLIACAHGGTSMLQWNPVGAKADGRTLFGATMRRLQKNGGRVAGVIWYQGESDTLDEPAPLYTERMKKLISAFRRIAGDKTLPFVLVQLARHTIRGDGGLWNSIQDQQRLLPNLLKQVQYVPAIDLELDDAIHISGESQQVLGERLARVMLRLRGDREQGRMPIKVAKIESKHILALNYQRVEVTFDHVVGGLRTHGRAAGFSVSDTDGNRLTPYKTVVSGNKVLLHFGSSGFEVFNLHLSYGAGFDPACTITDGDGWPLPVFGPVAIVPAQAVTSLAPSMKCSGSTVYDGDIRALKLPRGLAALLRRSVTCNDGGFMDVHALVEHNQPNHVIYMRAKFTCVEAMNLELMLGYDGPIKIWLDGREVMCDPSGKNPAAPDVHQVPARVKRGEHRVEFALGTNNGKACGVFLRLRRKGVPKRVIEAGEAVLPQWVAK